MAWPAHEPTVPKTRTRAHWNGSILNFRISLPNHHAQQRFKAVERQEFQFSDRCPLAPRQTRVDAAIMKQTLDFSVTKRKDQSTTRSGLFLAMTIDTLMKIYAVRHDFMYFFCQTALAEVVTMVSTNPFI